VTSLKNILDSTYVNTSVRLNATVLGAASISKNFDNDVLKDVAASNVRVSENPPIEFESVADFEGLHYVGYIVEKERLQDSGVWKKVDEFKIVGSRAIKLRDSRVAYDQIYRYRIKSIMKLTVKKEQEDLSVFNAIEDLKTYKKNELDRLFSQNEDLISSIDEYRGLSSLLSSGQTDNIIKLNEEYSVISDGFNTKVINTTSKKVLSIFDDPRLLRNLLVSNDLMTAQTDIEVKTQQNKELSSVVRVSYSSIYFESLPTEWKYVETINFRLPPPPQSIKIIPNSANKKIIISWLTPPTKFTRAIGEKREYPFIISFNIYKRNRLGNPWIRVGEIKEGIGYFEDKNVEFREKYIYAISSVDIHGIESFLSVQTQAELNENFNSTKEEKPLKWISGGGLKVSEVNSVIKKFYSNKEKIVAYKSVSIKPSETLSEDRDYIIKITSLDTHEQKEFKISLKNNFLGRIEITEEI